MNGLEIHTQSNAVSPWRAEIAIGQAAETGAEVDEIGLHIDRRASRGIRVALELWNWETETWDLQEDIRTEDYVISNPEPYLGPLNMVDIRVSLGDELGSARMQGLWVTQAGNF